MKELVSSMDTVQLPSIEIVVEGDKRRERGTAMCPNLYEPASSVGGISSEAQDCACGSATPTRRAAGHSAVPVV